RRREDTQHPAHEGSSKSDVAGFAWEDQSSDLLVTLSRCARILITLRAKYGVWVTRKRNCFSEMGTSSTSVIATAVALRGSLSIRAISPKILSVVRSAIVLLPT